MTELPAIQQQKIIHVDMDAFYVSVEIRDNPTLLDKPVAVGGQSDRRGVLSTCNYIARQFGVHSAMSTHLALKKCPDLVVLPGRMEVYKSVSADIHRIFERYTDIIEPLSLDEAYLDVSNCSLFNGSATLIAQDIRSCIANELKLTASAGIAPLKFLAKVASDLHKPNGQYVIPPSHVIAFIEQMPLSKIPGVGKVTFEKLQAHGFKLGKDIRASDQYTLVSLLGKLGYSLWDRCQGIDNREVETSRIRKSVGVERTFSYDITDTERLRAFMHDNLLPELLKRSAKYLDKRDISKLGVKVKFTDFQQTTKEFKYRCFNETLFDTLLDQAILRGEGKAVRLLGVHIGLGDDVDHSEQFQLTLI